MGLVLAAASAAAHLGLSHNAAGTAAATPAVAAILANLLRCMGLLSVDLACVDLGYTVQVFPKFAALAAWPTGFERRYELARISLDVPPAAGT